MRTLDPIVLIPGDGAPTEGPEPTNLYFGELHHNRHLINVTVPTLTPVLADEPNGTAVVIAPGGGWHELSIDNEGLWVAEELAKLGINAFVLSYRLQPRNLDGTPADGGDMGDHEYMMATADAARPRLAADGAAAVALVRERAGEWGVDPEKIGMMGFSAGGHVMLTTVIDRPETKLAFVVGIYPVAWFGITAPTPAPPLFLAWATDDHLGGWIIDSCLTLYKEWTNVGGSVEAHAFASGNHGFGVRPKGTESDRWFDELATWLRGRGLL